VGGKIIAQRSAPFTGLPLIAPATSRSRSAHKFCFRYKFAICFAARSTAIDGATPRPLHCCGLKVGGAAHIVFLSGLNTTSRYRRLHRQQSAAVTTLVLHLRPLDSLLTSRHLFTMSQLDPLSPLVDSPLTLLLLLASLEFLQFGALFLHVRLLLLVESPQLLFVGDSLHKKLRLNTKLVLQPIVIVIIIIIILEIYGAHITKHRTRKNNAAVSIGAKANFCNVE